MNEQQKFFKLLKYSNELKKNKKSLLKEDPEAFDMLLHFLVRIERNLHYSEKQEYIELARDFLTDQITADDFSYSFMAIYGGIGQKLGQMKRADFYSSCSVNSKIWAQSFNSCSSAIAISGSGLKLSQEP